MTNTSRVCPKCGATVFADAPQGCCSVCLVRTGLASLDDENDEASEPTIARMLKDFGDYELLEEIGRGGQGVVYRARQKSLNRIVALKVIGLAHWATEAHVKRFRLEAEAAASLNHPCIVPIYEVGERDGACYFSMGLVDGGQLDAVAKREPMPIRHAAELIAKLARTVSYAHEHGILHRDIKPGNVLLDAKGEPHLTDFGLARLVETESTVTRTMEVLGTPSYMAPEQAVGNNERVSSATDIYGLGAVLYQLLTGDPPFAGGTIFETVRLVLDTEPRQPRLLNPKVDRDLATICLKCLDKDPQRRYSSALALAEDLERWLKHEPIRGRRTGIFTRGRKWVRRNPSSALLVASLVALAAAIGALAFALPFYWHRNLTKSSLPEKSIAVLPFENRSRDPDNAYFADSIQDEVLTRLSKIADLKVISRTSTQHYKSAPENLPEIANQLGVAHILEGSVQKSGDAVRVNVQLIKAANNSHLWADTFDRKSTDIFSLESEVAMTVADQLRAKLTSEEAQLIAAKPTDDPQAYDAYLRGLAYTLKSGGFEPRNVIPAQQYLKEAVRLDPKFALGWSLLSSVDAAGYITGTLPRTTALRDEAGNAAETALGLQPNLGEAVSAKAFYHYAFLKDYDTALRYFEQAARLLPSDSRIPEALAFVERRRGHWEQSDAYFNRAERLDPRNARIIGQHAVLYKILRRFPDAVRKFEDVLNITPDDPLPVARQAAIFQAMGDLPRASALLTPLYSRADDGGTMNTQAYQAILERRTAPIIPRLKEMLSKPDSAPDADKAELRFLLGWAQDIAGDHSGAHESWTQAKNELESSLKEQPESYLLIGDLALTEMKLGETASAMTLADRGLAVNPIEKDAMNGPSSLEVFARVTAATGDHDRSIAALKKLLTIPYEGPLATHLPLTPALLKLDPMFDPLRSDPRFEKLVEEAKQPIALELIEKSAPEKSIAVLPFQNLSKDEENAFFAGGVQDEILTNLARVADLKVISRTSVMKYKADLERNLREIAKTLGVSHVVEGSIQRAGGRVRVSVQLIDARTDAHLWAEHYERDFGDIFAIQSEIAERIATQLRAKLSMEEKAAIAERPTADLVAYAYYTQAKAIGDVDDWEGWEKSLNRKAELLEKATQRDPNFGLAYCALAKTQCDLFQATGGKLSSRPHLELAKKAAETALRIRPDLGEAHLELARYYYFANLQTTDFDQARDELVIARRTLPNNSEAIVIAARIDKRQNRWDASLANFQKVSELDPRNVEVGYFRRLTYLETRRYNELEQLIVKDAASGTLQDPGTQLWLAELKLAEGDPVAAQALLAQVPLEFSPIEWIWKIRFDAALYLRDYDAANRVIAATPAKFAYVHDGQPPESFADGRVALARGDKEKALSVFEAARKKWDATWGDNPKDQEYFRQAAVLDAGLGRKEDAIREALRAVDLMPIAKDSYWGPVNVADLALVYAWTGERDRALEQLETVATIPNGPTYGDLKFNPCWDSLRGDPRFDKLVAAAKAASR